MQRRQALGVISTNQINKPAALGANPAALKQQQTAKASSSAFNNENEVQQSGCFAAAAGGGALKSAKSNEVFDFDIYQEEAFLEFKSIHQNANVNVKRQEIKLKEAIANDLDYLESISTFKTTTANNKENVAKPSFQLGGADEEADEDDEEDEEEEEDEDEDDDDEDDEEENEKIHEEEDGISRLNLAAIVDNSTDDYMYQKERMIVTDHELGMSLMDSPMVLDDTIKFQSHSAHLSVVSHDIDDYESGTEEADEELDEEEKRKLMLAEQDNLLQSCLEYKDDILAYMRQMELENRPKAHYMKKQQDINSSMRSILVDWLVEVCEEYRLHMETLYLAVNYTDRFLSQMSVLRGKLQLVGTASMYIASKYEEITPPDVAEFVYITDDTYTKKQVLRMEHLLLKVLDFKMNSPTANWFLMHYLRFGKRHFGVTSQEELHRLENLARYVAELTLVDADTFLCYLPSQIAASAVYLALLCLERPWTKQIADTLGYGHDLSELKSCIADMHHAMLQAPTLPQQAIFEKYKQAKYDHVSLLTPPSSLPACFEQSQSQSSHVEAEEQQLQQLESDN